MLTPLRPVSLSPGLPVVLHLAPGELWCRACGSDGHSLNPGGGDRSVRKQVCTLCGSPDLVPAHQVLRPGEYIVTGADQQTFRVSQTLKVSSPSTANHLLPVETPARPLSTARKPARTFDTSQE